MRDMKEFLPLCLALLSLFPVHLGGQAILKKCCAADMQLDKFAKSCVPYKPAQAAAATTSTPVPVHRSAAAAAPTIPSPVDASSTATIVLATPTANASIFADSSDAALPTPALLMDSSHPNAVANLSEETLSELRRRVGNNPWWLPTGLLASYIDDPSNEVPFLVALPSRLTVRYASRPCHYNDTKHVVVSSASASSSGDRWRLLTNGTVLLPHPVSLEDGGEDEGEIALAPDEYCADRVASGKHVFLLCPCQKVTCINKCCKASQLMAVQMGRKANSFTCSTNTNDTWVPSFHHNKTYRVEEFNISHILLYGHHPQCSEHHSKFQLNDKPPSEMEPKSFWILANGSAMLEEWGHGMAYDKNDYCADWTQFEDGSITQNVYFCQPKVQYEPPNAENIVYTLMFLVGAACLVLTLAVYVAVPELRRTAHAKALMCHVATLAAAMSAGAAGHLHRRVDPDSCVAQALILQYFFLATFFWLNVMCFDISWTFRSLRRAQGKESKSRKFFYYSMYAWGCPTLILVITVVMEYAPGIPDDYLKPNFGVTVCWFEDKLTTFAYFYGPIAVLLVANAVLFATTAMRIRHAQRGASVLHKGDSAKHMGSSSSSTFRGNKDMYKIFLKLFCLMGVTWLAELVSWLVEDAAPFLAHVLNAINLLRSVAIFFSFCCKKKVWRLLRPRLTRWRLLPASWCLPAAADVQPSASSTNTVSIRLDEVAPVEQKSEETTGTVGNGFSSSPQETSAF